jgi:hypothetical protein
MLRDHSLVLRGMAWGEVERLIEMRMRNEHMFKAADLSQPRLKPPLLRGR